METERLRSLRYSLKPHTNLPKLCSLGLPPLGGGPPGDLRTRPQIATPLSIVINYFLIIRSYIPGHIRIEKSLLRATKSRVGGGWREGQKRVLPDCPKSAFRVSNVGRAEKFLLLTNANSPLNHHYNNITQPYPVPFSQHCLIPSCSLKIQSKCQHFPSPWSCFPRRRQVLAEPFEV